MGVVWGGLKRSGLEVSLGNIQILMLRDNPLNSKYLLDGFLGVLLAKPETRLDL